MAALHQLLKIEAPGDVLSPTSACQQINCGAKWKYRTIDKLPDPPTGALTQGSSVHEALGANFEQKIETKQDLPAEGVVALFRKAWDAITKGEHENRFGKPQLPTEFREDEDPEQLKAEGEALVRLYMDEAAPQIQPAAVELAVFGSIGGVRVRGFIDLLDVNGCVIDIKTPKRTPSDISPDNRFQVATYRALCAHANGEGRIDALVKLKKPKLVQQPFTVDDSDVQRVQTMYPAAQALIKAGFFLPNRQNYMCSRNYCAFWRQCEKDWGGKVGD